MIFVLLGVVLVVVLAVCFLVDKPPPVQLEGQRCLITGGSSGIGLATAIMMAQKGARVTLLARNTDKLEEAVEAVEEACAEEGCVEEGCAYPPPTFLSLYISLSLSPSPHSPLSLSLADLHLI